MDKKSEKSFKKIEKSDTAVQGQPQNVYEMLHKYGTYEIQPTNDSDNEFPEIAQGLPPEKYHTEIEPEFRGS